MQGELLLSLSLLGSETLKRQSRRGGGEEGQ